ncbi:MAG TPA: signal peptidase I [Solirubrobacteraceae bacterium]
MKTKSKSPIGQLVELVVIVATALALALGIQAFLVKPYRIPSSSMVPTLDVGQRVLVNRIGMHFGDPKVGNILVFHPPAGADDNVCGARNEGEGEQRPCGLPVKKRSDENFIKRVVAGPGDTVAIVGGHAIVNGKRQKDPFTEPCPSGADCNFPKPVKVPPDHWFMMGDNRGHSDDSRYWGPVPRKWIIGDAFATYWPPNRIGIF